MLGEVEHHRATGRRPSCFDEAEVPGGHACLAGQLELAAVVDIWRFEDGLIAEHWDVRQPVPEPSAVPNGMF
ncbi:hypothetical protein [Actinophytocola sp.]|uniref:nuclear transport factor 2 family protein n=1 Tax=Actinophytocola sp. TaxID=1872138 RepID=UPI00389ACAF2